MPDLIFFTVSDSIMKNTIQGWNDRAFDQSNSNRSHWIFQEITMIRIDLWFQQRLVREAV